ncbi:hypothetical protein D6833_04860 [Candidatus Parcubacteria bacterium]|nr:MAG: hypothetical protein D6833_04860 [Candidatus Parcubacteria bacterium]
MNNKAYRVFTIESGSVSEGAAISTLHLKGAGIDIPAVIIGEEGRGRERGVVPVGNPPMVPCPERNKDVWTSSDKCEKCGTVLGEKKEGSYTRNHPDQGQVQGRLMFAEVGQTKAGKPKFFSKEKATTDDHIIVVLRTKIGFRGGNSHTGDRAGWKCSKYGCDASGEGAVPEACPKCGATGSWDGPKLLFAEFPGKIITRGRIAQGAAGRAGGGEQVIALMPKDVVFRTSYSGRLYGAPSSHYYVWDGSKLLAATWDERAAADLF